MILSFLFQFNKAYAQTPSVVVSEYYNTTFATDEWIELLVINDNTDLRGYSIRDNGATHTSWNGSSYGLATFTNINLWNNLRAGTIIIVYLRVLGLLASNIDTIKTDGFIQIHAQYPGYLNGTALTIGGSGDIIQLRTSNNSHIHALAHNSLPGVDFTDSIPSSNKLNHNTSSSTGKATYISPGTNISEYLGYGSGIFSGSSLTNLDSDTTRGLPNSTNVTTANRIYWRSLRQPTYTNPTLNSITPNIAYTSMTLSWSACSDPNPADSTTGYIILRNTTNSFIAPSDSITYAVGNTIGTATVVANINFSSTLAFTDNYTLNCDSIVYYKIYAFRYGTDNINGNSFNAARGRAYNEIGTNTLSLTRPSPLTQNIISN